MNTHPSLGQLLFGASCLGLVAAACGAGEVGPGEVDDPYTDEQIGSTQQELPKAGGGSNGDLGYCSDTSTVASRCVAGEGDCNSNAECFGGSICGMNIGIRFGVSWQYDFCTLPTCLNGIQDNGETGVDCGTAACGPICACETGAPGNAAYCTLSCKCSAGGGDCDSDNECQAGLYCAPKIGELYGQAATNDVCIPLQCKDNVQNNGETGVDCGGQCPPCLATTADRVSVSSAEVQANGLNTLYFDVSADGRYVAFGSEATNLVAGDTNGVQDIFVRDRFLGTTTRVSVPASGTQANGRSQQATISDDGRYVAFISFASNLVTGDTNGQPDVFVKDRTTGSVVLINKGPGGVLGNGAATSASISGNGRFVAYSSTASNIVAGDTNGVADVFVSDRVAIEATRRISIRGATQPNGASDFPTISDDGTWITFQSWASNLVAGDTNGTQDVFYRHRTVGSPILVSATPGGTPGTWASITPYISGNGNYIAFRSDASNLVADDTNGTWDIFVRNRVAGTTVMVSRPTGAAGVANGTSVGVSIDRTGNLVAFSSQASNLVAGDVNGYEDIFVRNVGAATTTRIAGGNQFSQFPIIAPLGGFVVFRSEASDLVPGDTNGVRDIFSVVVP